MILSPTALNSLSALVDLLDIKKGVKKMSDKICYKILKITIVLIKSIQYDLISSFKIFKIDSDIWI